MIKQPILLGAISTIAALAAHTASAEIEISSTPTQNMSCSAGVCTPAGHHPVLNVSDLAAMLAGSDVIVATEPAKHDGGIEVVAPLSWASAHKLTLEGKYVSFTPIRIGSPVVIAGQGGFVVDGDLKIDPGASITFWDTNSTLTVGFNTYQLVSNLPTLVGDIAANPNGAFALANDYDAHSDSFRKSPIPLLQGQLTGLGHTISNLTVTHGDHSCEGFVAVTAYDGTTVSDLSLHNVNVMSDGKSRNVGGVVGCNSGHISNVAVDGAVSGIANANVGGIAGENATQISITHAVSSASVTGGQAGGLVGESNGQINGSSASGAVVGSINAGGLVGSNNFGIYGSYATGAVSGTNNVGGLVGSNHGSVNLSYSTGAVSGGTATAGGIAGFNVGSISESYSIGAVSGSQGYIGGFVGNDPNETISFGYWDTDTSGISNPAQGAGSPANDPGIEGLTSAQLQAKLPYGFEKGYWRLSTGVNGGYPYLRFNPPQ